MRNDKVTIILNGPPGSGKDTIGDMLQDAFCDIRWRGIRKYGINMTNIDVHQFKQKLFELTMAIYSVDYDDFFDLYNDRELKEKPSELFGFLSPRQAMIRVSENIIKPAFGKNYFGEAAAKLLNEGINIFTDGGFNDELIPIKRDSFVYLIHLYRDGCDFTTDSRRYITDNFDMKVDFKNEAKSLEELRENIDLFAYKILLDLEKYNK